MVATSRGVALARGRAHVPRGCICCVQDCPLGIQLSDQPEDTPEGYSIALLQRLAFTECAATVYSPTGGALLLRAVNSGP